MNQHAQPIKDSKSSTVVQNKGEQSGDVFSGDQISDSRAESFHMERTKSLVNKSSNVNQLMALQNRANSSTKVKQLKVHQNLANKTTSQFTKKEEGTEVIQGKFNTIQRWPWSKKEETPKATEAPAAGAEGQAGLEGELTMGAKLKGFFGMESTFSKMQKMYEKYNEGKDEKVRESQRKAILSLAKTWLDKHKDSTDKNDLVKKASIEGMIKKMQPEPVIEEDQSKDDYINKQNEKIEGYRNEDGELSSKRLGGFIGVMKDKMVDLVKGVQDDEGSIQQADNYIHGDAATNAFFADEIKKAKGMDLGAVNKVNAHANEVFSGTFKNVVMPGGGLQTGPIQSYKSSSLAAARASNERVKDSAGDRVIVEMYYNEVEKLKDEDNTNESKEKVADLYKFAKARKFDVGKRRAEQKAVRNDLEKEGRISDTLTRTLEATKYAIGSAIFKTVTLGFGNIKKNRDKRGLVAKEDFTLDLETGDATQEKFQSKNGTFDFQSPIDQMKEIKGEFNSKMKKRIGMGAGGFFSALSLGLEAGKRFLGLIKGVFSTVALWATGLSLIPGAQVMAGVAAFCGTISYYIGLVMSGLTVIRGLLDGMAQTLNNNPALFSELSAETKKSALDVTTEGAAFGLGTVGAGALREKITGQDRMNDQALYDPTSTLANKNSLSGDGSGAPSTLSNEWFQDKSAQAGGILVADIGMSATNAGVTAGVGSMDNSDMTHTQSVNKNRRIGKPGKKTAKADEKETALIMQAFETTKAKAKKSGAKLIPVVKKFASEKAPSTSIETTADVTPEDRESASKLPVASKLVSSMASEMTEGMEDLQNQ